MSRSRWIRPAVVHVILLFAIACASPRSGAAREDISTIQRMTFLHAGFGAGPVVFTDDTGHLVEERRYEPFGQPVDAGEHTSGGDVVGGADLVARDLNPLGKRTEIATGWSDHGARWLAPETGRWLSTDPPVTGPGATFMAAPWALHPYQYVDQNPVAFWDPDGKCAAPTLGPGEVGFCIEAYIARDYADKILGVFPVGDGNHRGPAGNDPSKTSKIQELITVDLKTGKITNTTDIALSHALGMTRRASGSSVITDLSVDGADNIGFTAGGHAVNGFSGLPAAPKGSIDYRFRFNVDADGNATLTWGIHKGFPSYSVYSYKLDEDGLLITTPLHQSKERELGDLRTSWSGVDPLEPYQGPDPGAHEGDVKVLTSENYPSQ